MGKNYTEHYYKQISNVQTIFLFHVKSVVDLVEELLNPFTHKNTDLYELDTNVIMLNAVTYKMITAGDLVLAQYQKYIEGCFDDNNIAFGNTIHMINLPLLYSHSDIAPAKFTSKISNP